MTNQVEHDAASDPVQHVVERRKQHLPSRDHEQALGGPLRQVAGHRAEHDVVEAFGDRPQSFPHPRGVAGGDLQARREHICRHLGRRCGHHPDGVVGAPRVDGDTRNHGGDVHGRHGRDRETAQRHLDPSGSQLHHLGPGIGCHCGGDRHLEFWQGHLGCHAHELHRLHESSDVFSQAERGGAGVEVHHLEHVEHRRPSLHTVGQDVHGGFAVRHELAV